MKLTLRSVLSVLVSTQIAAQPLYAHADQGVVTSGSAPVSTNQASSDLDPVWQQFQSQKPTADFKLAFDAADPAIDQEPYFMRAQSWIAKRSSEMSYSQTQTSVIVELPEVQKALKIEVPLVPLQATEDYVFFSLNSTSDLFQRAAGSGEATGEGLFFLSRHDLKAGKPAQVFFYPLAGQGWTGALQTVSLAQSETLVVANAKESVAIDLHDVESAMKVQKMNLMIAQTLTSKNSGEISELPARGMTAAFGLFFTGLDLDHPAKSFWAAAPHGLQNKFIARLGEIVQRFMPEEKAHAVLDAAVVDRLIYVSAALSAMMFASIVIKSANPAIRKKLASFSAPATTPLAKARQQITRTFDVFAAVTTTTAQISSITFANSLELFLDRFAPTMAASDHTLVRRFLKNTFYFSRNAIADTPVNAKTFALGAVVMGGVDTACVAIQYEWAVPMIAQVASRHVDAGTRDLINETFDPLNPNTKQIALQDEVRTGLSWLQSGASSYSQDARAQQIEQIEKEVDARLRSVGIDPADPEHQTERRQAIETKMNVVLKQKGLPDSSQFLFDANTLFSALPKALGYQTPESLEAAETFILQKRFGLTKNALARAVAAAQAWVAQDQSTTAKETLALLQETSRDMSFLKAGIRNGRAGLARARAVRQELTLLSYEGSVSVAVRFLPETWTTKASPAAAQAAGLIFRQALFSYLSKEGESLVIANKSQADKFGRLARENARKELLAEHPGAVTLTPELEFELKLRTQLGITRLVEADETAAASKDYEPPKLDWLARRQQARALRTTEARLDAFLKTEAGAKASDEKVALTRNQFMLEASAREVGLHLETGAHSERSDYVAMMTKVEQKTIDSLKASLKSDPKLEAYVATLSEPERAKAMSVMYANEFLVNYKEATTELELVKPLDPAQPGRLQRLRQTEIVRASPFLTRTLRAFESFGDDQNLKFGLYGAISRNVPLAMDLISTHRRALKTFLPSMTVAYAWNYYAWQVHMPYSAWGIFILTGAATISTPSQWLNRVFRVEGLKPMDSVISKVLYALPYSWVTFVGMFPVLMYQKGANIWFSDVIRTPVMSVIDQFDPKVWIAGAAALGTSAVVARRLKKREFATQAAKRPARRPPAVCADIFAVR